MLTLQEFIATQYLNQNPGPLSQDFRLEFVCNTRSDRFSVVRSGNEVRSFRGNQSQERPIQWPFASISKPIVSFIAIQLAEAEKLDLDQTVVSTLAIANEKFEDPRLKSVTIRHLLSHTSGLPAEVSESIWINLHFPSKRELIHAFCTSTLKFDPGTQICYSNFAYSLGALAIERITSQSIQELWKRQSTEDRDLEDIRFCEILDFFSIIHDKLGGRSLQLNSYGPAGSVVAPSISMANFMKIVITEEAKAAASHSEGNLSRLEADRETALLDPAVGAKVGLLWHHTELDNVTSKVIYHTGTLPGVSSFIIGLPQLDLSAAFVTNQNLDTKPIMKELVRDLALVDEWTGSNAEAATIRAVYEMPHFDSRITFWGTDDHNEVITLEHYNQSLKIFRIETKSENTILRTPSGEKLDIRFLDDASKALFCEQVYLKRNTTGTLAVGAAT